MYASAYRKITKLVRGRAALPRAMRELVDVCRAAVASPVWDELDELPYAADREAMTAWLERLLTAKPPPPRINGLWFGLFNRSLDDGVSVCCLHLAGSSRFNVDNPSLACFAEPQYLPAKNSTQSEVLTAIGRAVQPFPETQAQAEYTLCWGYACLLARDWCRGPQRERLLGPAQRRAVAVGFDSGDGLVVDVLERT